MLTGKTNLFVFGILQSILLIPQLICAPLIDLQDMAQDFVLETKQINIPGFAESFNPSLLRWENYLILTFRVKNPLTGDTNQTGFVLLNEDLEIISDPKPLEILFDSPPAYSKIQDPRLVTVGNKHYVVFNNQIGMAPTKEIRRMFVAELHFDGARLFTENPEALLYFDTPQFQYQEKNWAPFDYKNKLLLSYSINPHHIKEPILGSEYATIASCTECSFDWNWGTPRGGTPALLIGNQYLAFFHSSQLMATLNSKGKPITHYFMGAYTFSSEPPFELTAISPEPIVGQNFYCGKSYNTWKPLLVVFPCGIMCDEKYIWVSYGRQDHEVWIAKLDKKGLLNSLQPVVPAKEIP
jgi:predicted GH43/DUF377 family glycosyl hydrolase